MQTDNTALWPLALDYIRKEVDNEQVFSVWFNPIKLHSLDSHTATLEVPNKFFKGWLLERYAAVLRSSLEKAAGRELTIEFTLAEEGDGPLQPVLPPGDKEGKDGRKGAFWPFAKPLSEAAKEIGLKPHYTFDSFVEGPSNRFARAASLAVSDSLAKAYNPLFIYGGTGLGKTHLMHAIAHRVLHRAPKTKVLYLSSETFTNQLISALQNRSMAKFKEKYRNVDILLIDDIQFIAGKESTQEEFFHTFNALYDAHKQIVVSSDRPPKEIHLLEERLISRFEWGLVTDVQPPDFETRMAILKKKSEKETIALPDDVFYFLAEKIKTNIRELEGALIRVVAYAKLIGRQVTVELVKEVLKDMLIEGERKVTIDLIQKKVSEYFDIKLSDMRAKKRSKTIAYPRQIAMYLARQLTDFSLPEIGEQFGGRDHTTVIHACDKIEGDMKAKEGVKKMIDNLILGLRG